jgi:dTDP-4-dehydrorhamnose 3,5-epimerase
MVQYTMSETKIISQDQQTVTPDGQRLEPRIQGLQITPRLAQIDERGELTEMYNPAWGLDPLVYAYMVIAYPSSIRAWVMHKEQEDRLFMVKGYVRWAFFDARVDSATHGMLSVHTFSERQRIMLTIPPGVFHGVQNIGLEDAIFINMPSRPYNHKNPDKYRLPIKNDLIPFDFS